MKRIVLSLICITIINLSYTQSKDNDTSLHQNNWLNINKPITNTSKTNETAKEPSTIPQYREKANFSYSLDNQYNTVSLAVYDILGNKVFQYMGTYNKAGTYQVDWDGKDFSGKNVATGYYFYRIAINGEVSSAKKMVITQ